MPNPTTYSFEVNLTRATRIGRAVLRSFNEPSTGTKEASFTTVIAPSTTVNIGIGDIVEGRMILVNAKPEGGVDDVNALLQLTNTTGTGVDTGTQDVRFGSFIIIADAKFTAVALKNLDTLNAITVEIFVLGN